MEVPGKREDPDLEKGSQGNAREFCQPCGCEGKHVPAEGFCQTCGDYLCAECFKVHTIPRPSRNHVLLDKAKMPRSTQGTRKPKTNCTIICPDHHDKVVEFFCNDHNAGLCGVCAFKKHKQCDTVYIPDVAEEYKGSKEFASLLDTLNHLETDIKTLSTDIKDAFSSVIETSEHAIQEIRQFRKELNDYLDMKEQELVLATNKMEQEDTKFLQDLTDELTSLREEHSGFLKQLKSVGLDNEIGDLFVTSKQLMKKIQTVLDKFTICKEKNKVTSYIFERGHALRDLLVSNTDFGNLKKICHPKNVSYCYKNTSSDKATNIDFTSKVVERKSEMRVRTSEDRRQPRITGMVLLSPHTLLLADCDNNSVKTVDTTSNTIISRLSLSSSPWDIALLPQDQAAVTLPNNREIQIISTKDRLSAVRTVNVDGRCYGISATMDNLIVCYCSPSKVDIMDLQGSVMASVRKDSNEQDLFREPYYNTIVAEKGVLVIHVSDYKKNSITKLSLGGQVLSTYTHENWNGLLGIIATGDGQLLVCNRNNGIVDIISEGGKEIRTLLDTSKQYPESICFCAEQNTLYVNSLSNGTVQTYKFT